MIITCPKDSKKFEVDSKLIPEEGRLLQCGSCGYKWHYKNEVIKTKEIITKNVDIIEDTNYSDSDDKKTFLNNNQIDPSMENVNIYGKDEIKQIKEVNLSKILKISLVLVISFISLIIVLDTLEPSLRNTFPNLENILKNLYETLKDINLFFKDLFN